jgi:NAD(P)H-flavin reductase
MIEPVGAFVPRLYRVDAAHRETHDTATLELVPQEGDAPAYRPGQFNMLYAFGVGEVAISVSGDASDPSRLVHTVRDLGAASAAIAHLRRHAVVGLRGPYGSAWPMDAAEGGDVLIVAGGLGLAPLRPAIYHLLRHRGRYGRIAILYGARTPSEVLFGRELARWRKRGDLDVLLTVAALREAGLGDDKTYVSMERNMKCAVGLCGRCQYGPSFVCKDGPVMRVDRIANIFGVRGI